MKKTKLLISTASAVLLLASLMAVSAFATTVPTFTLSASSNQLQYVLPEGTTFNGTISTTGSVRVWVSAPSYAEIVNLGIIDKTTTFGFVAHAKRNLHAEFRERHVQLDSGDILVCDKPSDPRQQQFDRNIPKLPADNGNYCRIRKPSDNLCPASQKQNHIFWSFIIGHLETHHRTFKVNLKSSFSVDCCCSFNLFLSTF